MEDYLSILCQQETCSQEKMDDIFKGTKWFGITEDVLVVGYDKDDTCHDEMLWRVLKIYRKGNLQLNIDKSYFRFVSIPFFC